MKLNIIFQDENLGSAPDLYYSNLHYIGQTTFFQPQGRVISCHWFVGFSEPCRESLNSLKLSLPSASFCYILDALQMSVTLVLVVYTPSTPINNSNCSSQFASGRDCALCLLIRLGVKMVPSGLNWEPQFHTFCCCLGPKVELQEWVDSTGSLPAGV